MYSSHESSLVGSLANGDTLGTMIDHNNNTASKSIGFTLVNSSLSTSNMNNQTDANNNTAFAINNNQPQPQPQQQQLQQAPLLQQQQPPQQQQQQQQQPQPQPQPQPHQPQQQQNHQQQQPIVGPKPRGRRKKIRTEPVRPVCPQCEKQFSNQSALTKHKLTHSDERKFACQQCSKAFKRHDHLTGHMQTHSNRKPFNCTIQGCDKTYCDARSLRRHKENIHHIVTRSNSLDQPQSANGNVTPVTSHPNTPVSLVPPAQSGAQFTSLTSDDQQLHQQQHLQQQQQQHLQPPTLEMTQTSQPPISYQQGNHETHQPQPSHLLCRRIQRKPIMEPPQHLGLQNQHSHQHHYHRAAYSADYASAQHFSFDFNNSGQLGTYAIPQSADSTTDSGLSLNVHHEQSQLTPSDHQHAGYITPVTLHPSTPVALAPPPPPPQSNSQFGSQSADHQPQGQQQQSQQISQQQPQPPPSAQSSQPAIDYQESYHETHQPQPSHLLCRRIQRKPMMEPPQHLGLSPHQHSLQNQHLHQHEHQHQYDHLHQHQQQHQQQHHYHQPSYSADYASTQHFSFDFNHSGQQGTHAIPQNADSTTDSGLSLNMHHEQNQLTPSDHQHHQHAGYITPVTLHPPTPVALAPPPPPPQSNSQFTGQSADHQPQGQQQQPQQISQQSQPSPLTPTQPQYPPSNYHQNYHRMQPQQTLVPIKCEGSLQYY